MKALHAALLCVAAACATAAEARTAAEFFATAPDAVFRLLPQSTRLDMLDYFRFGSDKASANNLGGEARVTAESPATVKYTLGERAHGQLAVLASRQDTVIAVVTTVLTPVPDSSIDFYYTTWQPVRAHADLPAYSDWLTPEGHAHADRAAELVPFVLTEALFDPDAGRLTVSSGAAEFAAPEVRDEVRRYFRPDISYAVEGTRLIRQKP